MNLFMPVASFLAVIRCVLAIDELMFLDNADLSVQEMRKAGKEQYQILQERSQLPKYGDCWIAALEHVEESCRVLTEESQSDVALHITNCFLEMSGHDVYRCESDKKPNLRAICLQSMTDRAFNVYTEFFTHALNICWFLRGQLWQETIEENTRKVGMQLDKSFKNQEVLLQNQQQSLELQDKILEYGKEMDDLLGRFVATTKQHQDLIQMLTTSVSNLQSWLIGEVSWLDSAVFYILTSFFIIFITSTPRCLAARLPMFTLLVFNIFLERLICYNVSRGLVIDVGVVHGNYYNYVSYLRYIFIVLVITTLAFHVFTYKDYLVENHLILESMNETIRDLKHSMQLTTNVSNVFLEDNLEFKGNSGSVKTPQCGTDLPHISSEKCKSEKGYDLPASRDSSKSSGRLYNLRERPSVTLNSLH